MIKIRMKKQASGFTLVELLVVIAIISILTVITVSQFNSARMKSRDVQRKGDLNGVYKALLMYYSDYGRFPDPGGESDLEKINELWGGNDFKGSDGYIYFKGMPSEVFFEKGSPQYCYEVSRDEPTDPVRMVALYARLENRNDEEFEKYRYGGYSCSGSSVIYNYVIYSPNAGPGDFGDDD